MSGLEKREISLSNLLTRFETLQSCHTYSSADTSHRIITDLSTSIFRAAFLMFSMSADKGENLTNGWYQLDQRRPKKVIKISSSSSMCRGFDSSIMGTSRFFIFSTGSRLIYCFIIIIRGFESVSFHFIWYWIGFTNATLIIIIIGFFWSVTKQFITWSDGII